MDKINIRQAKPEDFGPIAELVASQNRHAESHCIHSETGLDAQGICDEMIRLDLENSLIHVVMHSEEQVIGTMGCELDVELGRGWLRGPFVAKGGLDWESASASLYSTLQGLLPASIRQLDTYLDVQNVRGNEFYFSQGFKKIRLVHLYECLPLESGYSPQENCQRLAPAQSPDFVSLHDMIFPGTYATGARILEKINDQHQVFVSYLEGELAGYCCGNVDPDTGEGSVDFLGVREDCRGQGIGRKLLLTTLHWLFETARVPKTILVVHDELADARSLYESVGFRLKYTGVQTRKSWN